MRDLVVAEAEDVKLPDVGSCDGAVPHDFPTSYFFRGSDGVHRQYVKGPWAGIRGAKYEDGFLDDKWQVSCIGCDNATVITMQNLIESFKRGDFGGKLIP